MPRPAFCSQAGGKGRRTSSKWAFAITARRSGFGMPFLFVLPSLARREHRLDQALEAAERGGSRSGSGRPRRPRSRTCAACPARRAPPRRLRRELAVAGLEGRASPDDDLEALGLVRVDVRGGDEAVRLDDDLDRRRIRRSCRRRVFRNCDQLAGDRVVQDVSGANHRRSVSSRWWFVIPCEESRLRPSAASARMTIWLARDAANLSTPHGMRRPAGRHSRG